jgi:hypothetical protein
MLQLQCLGFLLPVQLDVRHVMGWTTEERVRKGAAEVFESITCEEEEEEMKEDFNFN